MFQGRSESTPQLKPGKPRGLGPVGALLAAAALAASAGAQGTLKVASRSSSGERAGGDFPTLSADGSLTAFISQAVNLVPGDTNGLEDIFVHDRISGTTTRVSVSSSGAQGDGACFTSVISPDGRYVAFSSASENLAAGDANGQVDVFIHNRTSGVTTLVSKSSSGAQGDDTSWVTSISEDGRFVVFESAATTLVPGDANGVQDVFVHDRHDGTTTLASLSSGDVQGDGQSGVASISGDGRYLAFWSEATNLAPGDTNGFGDIFLRDRVAGTTTLVSVATNGAQGDDDSVNDYAGAISADGRLVVFASLASNFSPGDPPGTWDVFVRDVSAGTTALLSVHAGIPTVFDDSNNPWISADGRFVGFWSNAADLVPGDVNGTTDVFVRELATGTTRLVSRSASGELGNGQSMVCALSADGRFVAFQSYATNLVGGGVHYGSVFVSDRLGCSPTVARYCAPGTTGHGCVPSMSASGTPSASAGSGFTLSAGSLEGGVPGLLFYGVSGPAAIPWAGGASTLCVRTPLMRMTAQSSGGTPGACDGALVLDWNAWIASHPAALGTPFADGATVWAQAWFRDPLVPGGSSLSEGVWFDVCP